MPKNPMQLDRAILKNGGSLETAAGTEIITVSDAGVPSIKANIEDALPSGDIFVGDSNGVTSEVTMSGDATISNTGVLTVTASTAAFAVGTTLITASTTATSGAGAVAITGMIHEVTTSGIGDALTLVDGAEGQHLNVVYVAEGGGSDTAILTPSNLAGGNTTVTFNDLGDAAHLLFTAGAWYFLGGEAVVAA